MSYTSTATATKPEEAVWFNKANPTLSKGEIDWVKTQPGFISHTIVNQGANTVVSTLVFETKAAFDTMAAQRATRADYQARQTYCAANDITKSVSRG